jgi:hypothetical protein
MRLSSLSRLAVLTCGVAAVCFGASTMQTGKAGLKSAGALAIGPEGVLFVGDTAGGAIYALDVNDRAAGKLPGSLEIKGINEKVAALLGTTADQISINDVVVNPVSKNVYISASRGKGPDAAPAIVRVDAAGTVTEVALDNIKHSSVALPDRPQADRQRMDTITSIKYVDGKVFVAGLSNEEFSSSLRSIPYPFKTAEKGTQLQIWHSSHGRYETQAPVRTFVPYSIDGKQYVLAAYTCTPLVKIPVTDLKAGAQVKGVTISDLGAGNQPLDMVPYKKDGHEFILIANSSFGVVKLHADNLGQYKPIDSPTVVPGAAGAPYDKIAAMTNVRHLTQFDATRAVVLTSAGGGGFGPATGPFNIQTVALP